MNDDLLCGVQFCMQLHIVHMQEHCTRILSRLLSCHYEAVAAFQLWRMGFWAGWVDLPPYDRSLQSHHCLLAGSGD